MSLIKAEYNRVPVCRPGNYQSAEHQDTPERPMGIYRAVVWSVSDGDPHIDDFRSDGILPASPGKKNKQVFVGLFQTTSDTANSIFPSRVRKENISSARINECELRAKNIAAEIYKRSQEVGDIELLRYCFEVIESAFSKADLDFVDCLLETLDASKIQVIGALGIARATGRVRKRLPMWGGYVARLKEHLVAQGEVVSQSMRGLINTNDKFIFIARRVAL